MKYKYKITETSEDTRYYIVESNEILTEEEIQDHLANVKITDTKNSYEDEDLKITFLRTEFGDNTEIDIQGSDLKEEDYDREPDYDAKTAQEIAHEQDEIYRTLK